MAFSSSTRVQSAAANNQSDDWKAQGFLNFALTDASGRDVKVGAIPLKESVEVQKWIIDVLTAKPEQLPKLIAKMKVSYNSATPAKTAGFSLD